MYFVIYCSTVRFGVSPSPSNSKSESINSPNDMRFLPGQWDFLFRLFTFISVINVVSTLKGSSHYPSTGNSGYSSRRPKYAIMVDAENSQPSKLSAIVEEIVGPSLGGDATVRRVYGDLTTNGRMANWKKVCMEASFLPVNTFMYVYGKGTSDSALIIDAMELLYTNPSIDAFALVSSDSDFTRLAQKIREQGKFVVGFGQRHTPSPFVSACERFVYVENLQRIDDDKLATKNDTSVSSVTKRTRNGTTIPPEDLAMLQKAIDETSDRDDGYVLMSVLGDYLAALKSDFDVRNYGYKRLSQALKDHPEHFESTLADDRKTFSVRNNRQQ